MSIIIFLQCVVVMVPIIELGMIMETIVQDDDEMVKVVDNMQQKLANKRVFLLSMSHADFRDMKRASAASRSTSSNPVQNLPTDSSSSEMRMRDSAKSHTLPHSGCYSHFGPILAKRQEYHT